MNNDNQEAYLDLLVDIMFPKKEIKETVIISQDNMITVNNTLAILGDNSPLWYRPKDAENWNVVTIYGKTVMISDLSAGTVLDVVYFIDEK